jgi:glycerate dehydrogenase
MKIVFLDAKTMGDIPNMHLISELGEFTLYSTTRPEEAADRLKDADIAITCKVVFDRLLIKQLPLLKLICVAATGMNNVDVDYARSAGIQIKNVPNYSTNNVTQVTFAMLLALLNQTNYYDQYVKSGEYTQNDMFTHIGKTTYELAGKRYGIIGLGNIGRKVASIAEAFDCEVCYFSTTGKNKNPAYEKMELDSLLKVSDIVSIHANLNDNTRNLITYEKLKLMKTNAILLNMSRGGIVNEADIARALNENLIAGAAFDVFSKEPVEKTNPLLSINNPEKIILSPHSAWTSIDARTRLIAMVAENIKEFQKGNSH